MLQEMTAITSDVEEGGGDAKDSEGLQEGVNLDDLAVATTTTSSTTAANAKEGQGEHAEALHHMGVMTAVAIGIHNFPEGLATFVATLADPVVGATLAVAIGIHNIPEGLCVSIPIYYATGNRWKAFGWAVLSGVSEPIGALLGYAILMSVMGDAAYAVLFGLVGGMMVMICLQQLLPTANRYDPADKVVTKSVVAGMLVMALSLVMFVL